ncbi:MAG: thiol protease/hemagglutinin PrtT [Bacteroidetes bacterium]|nr:thiol protease/hemagglutinin PrtT [Bacteroidota bacterium]
MKKILLYFFCYLFFLTTSYSKQIDALTAKKIGQNFAMAYDNTPLRKSNSEFTLVFTNNYFNTANQTNKKPTNLFYVFNASTSGFVIVAADDIVKPILGYSKEGSFNPNDIPESVQKWLDEYKNQIRYAIENNLQPSKEIKQEWENYLNSKAPASPIGSSVDPLVKTKWNQRPYVNDLCPNSSVTGCVATAMAQVLKFWNYPATGTGFHSYNHKSYGTLSSNFGSRTYQWDSMPYLVNSPNNAVATLMYDCGVSVNMNYSPSSSGAYVISSQSPVQNCTEYALKNYFDYKNTLKGVERKNYSESQWIAAIKKEIDEGRPVIYAGFGSGGGHCFICDGYDEAGFFHFNWGWGGSYDGYFSINALNPAGVGTGGGTGGFNAGHQAILGVEPADGTGLNKNTRLEINSLITVPDTGVKFLNAFQVSSNIRNFGISNFSGKLGAAIFDVNMQFIDFMDSVSVSIKADSSYSATFKNKGSAAYVPGKYFVEIFYKKSEGGWSIVGDSLFMNSAQILFKYSSEDIETNSAFTIDGGTLVLSENANIAVSVKNSSSYSTFVGSYSIRLSTLDGKPAQTIGVINETGIFPNANRNLNFSGIISVTPGTYLMDIAYKFQGTSQWYYAGSSNFSNPVYVKVVAPILSPDKYENNDSLEAAYLLPVVFSANTAKVKSTESNIHIGTDNDFYKIKLAPGDNYTITARLQDSYSSDDGNDYYVDALISYSLDSITWSQAYDDIIPTPILLNNKEGGTVYFHVAPYFEGENGTYLLDISVERETPEIVSEIDYNNLINLYPNPADNQVQIELSNSNMDFHKIDILNYNGQVVKEIQIEKEQSICPILLEHLSSGLYFVRIHSNHKIIYKKLIIN